MLLQIRPVTDNQTLGVKTFFTQQLSLLWLNILTIPKYVNKLDAFPVHSNQQHQNIETQLFTSHVFQRKTTISPQSWLLTGRTKMFSWVEFNVRLVTGGVDESVGPGLNDDVVSMTRLRVLNVNIGG